jgi:hypothetical protein
MALQIAYEDTRGTTHSAAYVRIIQIHYDIEYDDVAQVDIIYQIFASATARSKGTVADKKTPVTGGSMRPTEAETVTYFADSALAANTKSLLGQAYAFMKTQNDSDAEVDGNRLLINWTTGTTDV